MAAMIGHQDAETAFLEAWQGGRIHHAWLLAGPRGWGRSEEHTSELQSLMRISYAVFCLKKKNTNYEQKQCIDLVENLKDTRTIVIDNVTHHGRHRHITS